MIRAVRIRVGGDRFILAEVDSDVEVPEGLLLPESSEQGEGLPSDLEEVSATKRLGHELVEVKRVIVACCKELFESFEAIPGRPKKVVAEFGVKLGGEAGLPMVGKASGESSFKVSVEWELTPATDADGVRK